MSSYSGSDASVEATSKLESSTQPINVSALEFYAGTSESDLGEIQNKHSNYSPVTHALTSLPRSKLVTNFDESKWRSTYAQEKFTYFSTKPSIQDKSGPTFSSLFSDQSNPTDLFVLQDPFTWWLDCKDVTNQEIKMLCKIFNLSKFTGYDLKNDRGLEKVEFHQKYYFVLLHSFLGNPNKNGYLEPANVYMVVFKNGIMTFQSTTDTLNHCLAVRRRIQEITSLHEIETAITSDWICYAIIHHVVRSLSLVIDGLDDRTYKIGKKVFDVGLSVNNYDWSFDEFANSFEKKNSSKGLDLLKNKKEDRKRRSRMRMNYNILLHKIGVALIDVMRAKKIAMNKEQVLNAMIKQSETGDHYSPEESPTNDINSNKNNELKFIKPRAEVALYIEDVLESIHSQSQTLATQQEYLSRFYNSYLAQLQVASIYSSENMNNILSKITVFGAVFLPLSTITGFWGMNITVPGSNSNSLGWFFGISACVTVMVITGGVLTNIWINKMKNEHINSLKTSENLRIIDQDQNFQETQSSEESSGNTNELKQILTPVASISHLV